MKPVLFLRIASVLTMIHAVLHTVGGVFGKPETSAAAAVVAVMRANQFPVMGVTRSYGDFYMGLGLTVSIFLTIEAVVFWQLGTLAKTDARRLQPILAAFFVGYLAASVNSFAYFFFAPVITELLIAACLAIAFLTAKPAVA